MHLPFTPPLHPDNLFGHLVATAVPGVEEWRDGAYRRTVRLVDRSAIVSVSFGRDHLGMEGPAEAVEAVRFLFDLDADPAVIDAALSADPVLAPLVAAAPGRRVPRTVDPAEMALRAVLGQQVSTAAAATHTARLVRDAGEPIDDPDGGLTHLFPTPAAVAAVDPESLALPRARRATLLGLARALEDGLDLSDREALLALPGIGPWTVETIRMRALGDTDAFPATDLGLRATLPGLDPERWRPYRAYAVQHLWALGDHAINRMPA
ncbi:MAG: AraC family transcriptional regulator [Solirubrobacteraceae bacterium]|nr:AraC family transcriptional regulator [Solirubrobacteraceae bacterium]